MYKDLFIGVDGGASKCVVRVEDENGCLLGQTTSGSANIRISVSQTWESIHSALEKILQSLNIKSRDKINFHGGMGLAGCELSEAYQSFLNYTHIFKTLIVSTDSYTACLGAHGGQDGSIIIIGTGVVGFQIENAVMSKVGGWGFPNDDEGGGAWLGLEAVKKTLQWYDGRASASGLTQAVFNQFKQDIDQLVSWSNLATSTTFATLTPLIIQQSQLGDHAAIQLLKEAAFKIDQLGAALVNKQQNKIEPLRCCLVGGVAPFLIPYLGQALTARLYPCKATPDEGALMLLRNHMKQR